MDSAIKTTIDSFRQAWGIFEISEREKQQLIKTIEKHNPRLLSHVQGMLEMAELANEMADQLKDVATEQDLVLGKLKEADEEFKANFIKTTTLAYGLRSLFNDPVTMTEALTAITEPTLDRVMARLSHNDRLKLAQAIDRQSATELDDNG